MYIYICKSGCPDVSHLSVISLLFHIYIYIYIHTHVKIKITHIHIIYIHTCIINKHNLYTYTHRHITYSYMLGTLPAEIVIFECRILRQYLSIRFEGLDVFLQ